MDILTSYVIASVQRSGTQLLCNLLRSTGVAGLPTEHFMSKPGETWEDRWKTTSRIAYVERVLSDNTTSNGVFGTVIMWSYFDRMLQMLRDIPENCGLKTPDLLAAILHEPKYIWLRRRNRVEQAVSWAIAAQTGIWAQRTGERRHPRAVPKFDFNVVDEWCNRIGEHDAAWANYFRENQIPPLELYYEDVVANHRAAVERVLEFLGLPLPADMEIPQLRLQKQANEVSKQWTAAYLELKNASPKRRSQMIRRMKHP